MVTVNHAGKWHNTLHEWWWEVWVYCGETNH